MRESKERRLGWFKLPGQDGFRSVADQLRGLQPALDQVKGKTVLDLGCAEGAISREFARAGAANVVGVEIVAEQLAVAAELCHGLPCWFECQDLNKLEGAWMNARYDVLLLLAVIHKMREPAHWLSLVADFARELIVIRMPGFAYGRPPVRFQSERYGKEMVDCAQILQERGFLLARVERGPELERGPEPVLYFRRVNGS
jgi:SAM-dependent methyltransferase